MEQIKSSKDCTKMKRTFVELIITMKTISYKIRYCRKHKTTLKILPEVPGKGAKRRTDLFNWRMDPGDSICTE